MPLPDSDDRVAVAVVPSLDEQASSAAPWPVANLEHPWLGLESFREETRAYFFGRDAETAEIHLRLRSQPLLVLYGRSGFGKTSILSAGLIPRLHREGHRPALHRLSFEQGDSGPHDQLLVHLGVRDVNPTVPFPLPNDPACRLWLLLHRKLPWSGVTHLVLDQFEEVFTVESQRPETVEEVREALGILIQGAVPAPVAECLAREENIFDYFDPDSQPVRVILALRDDYVYALNRWRRHLPQLGQNSFELRALRGPAAFEAVFAPGCLRVHQREENGTLVDADTGLPPIVSEATARRIVRFVAEKKADVPLEEIEAVPPILSLLCRELNERRYPQPPGTSGPPLAEIVFDEQTTNVENILETFYERCLTGRPEAVRIFIEEDLVSRSGIRLQNDERSIVDAFANGLGSQAAGYGARAAATDCLHELVNERLLSPVSGGETARYELTHDLLCRVVYKSRTARQERIEKEGLERRAEQEKRAKEEAEAREKVERDLRQVQEKLAAENAKYAKEQKEVASKLRRLAWMLALLALTATTAAIFGFWQKREAEKQTGLARESEHKTARETFARLLATARYLLEGRKDVLALAYLAQALRVDPKNEGAGALMAAMLSQENWAIPVAGPIRHDEAVFSAQFSADGQRLVTASWDKTARVWDAVSGKAIGEPMRHQGPVRSAQFSADGQRVVTASEDKTARVWDAASGKAIGEPMRHQGPVRSAQFSADGQRVVTASEDKTAQVWDAASGKALGEPMRHDGWVYSAQFSADGQRVVTASDDSTARVWDAASGQAIGEPMRHEEAVRSAQFSADGQRVVTASMDKTAQVWDATSGKAIGEPMRHGDWVYSAQFSADGQRVVTASEDKTARVWDAASGQAIGEPMRHEGAVRSAQFGADGQRVVTASDDSTARVWDAASGQAIGEPMRHDGWVYSAQFSADGQRVVTASRDNTAEVWNALISKAIRESMRHGDWVYSAQFSADGQRVVTASKDRTARVWDAASGQAIGEPMRHEGAVISAQFSADGQRVVTASEDKTARLWDAASGKAIGEPMRHEDAVISAQFSADGQRVVTASEDKTARVWDAASGKAIGEPMRHDGWVYSAQFSPDGQRVVTASLDKTARVWDATSGKAIGSPIRHEDAVISAQFSADGRRVVTASKDKTAQVWDAASGQAIGEPMRHDGSVYSAQFSADGQRVVTASEDKTARVWDAASGQAIGEPMRHQDALRSAQFSVDGQRVVTASWDKTARVWDAASGKAIGEPMRHEEAVNSAQFSADGQRVVTASMDRTAQVWDLPTIGKQDTPDDLLLLAELAESASGSVLQASGQAEILKRFPADQVSATREKIAARFAGRSSGLTPVERLLKWSVADPRHRTISPFSKLTVPAWIENRIKEGTFESLRAAIQMDPANARLIAHFGLALANLAVAETTDPNEARRARAEADYQTRRAVKLASDNDEVKRLRAEVVKLLNLSRG
jgi:WD40 repeat protein